MSAKKPNDKEDPEVKAWLAKLKTEAEDLKLESFGVEVSRVKPKPNSTLTGL